MSSSARSFSVILFETIEIHRGKEAPEILDTKDSLHNFEQIEKIAAENHATVSRNDKVLVGNREVRLFSYESTHAASHLIDWTITFAMGGGAEVPFSLMF